MEIEQKYEFPCGYKYTHKMHVNSFSVFFGGFTYKYDGEKLDVCPMHGSKCRREVK
jgi:hypothetical protein